MNWVRALLYVLVVFVWAAPAQAATATFPAGSYIIDMGQSQTVASALKPYGLVYELVRTQRTPVSWAINPAKSKDGVDFVFNNKSYKGGPFIIDGSFASAAVLSAIAVWRQKGVVIDGPTGPITNVPVYGTIIQGVGNVIIDNVGGNGVKIIEPILAAAGIPANAYREVLVAEVSSCDDLFIMPHIDDAQWSSHSGLLNFVMNKGYIWAGCRSGSQLENLNPSNADIPSTPVMNFLSEKGLVPWKTHEGQEGSPPYTSILPAHPVMQFIGTTDAAQQKGSEQVYFPLKGTQWRGTTDVLVYDPTPSAVTGGAGSPAAAIVTGRAFGNSNYGRVMYEGGHDVGGTSSAQIAAQRALLNFWILALIERSPSVSLAATPSITSMGQGSTITLQSSVSNTSGVSYQWSSTGGGTFSNPNSATTTFTAPNVSVDTTFQLRLVVTDSCGRTAAAIYPILVTHAAKADLALAITDSKDPVGVGQPFSYTLSVSNLGPDTATGVTVTQTLPAGVVFNSVTPPAGSNWTCVFNAGKLTCTRPSFAPTAGTPSNITVAVTAPGTVGAITTTGNVSSSTTPDPVSYNNNATQTTQVAVAGIDVSITKTPSAGPYWSGTTFSYSLIVQNLSGSAATNLAVTDVLPASLTFVSVAGSGWGCAYSAIDSTVQCSIPSLAASAASTITVTVRPVGAGGTVISNTAVVSSPDFVDTNPANNSYTANITLAASADVTITKTGSTTGGGVGTQHDSWTVIVGNNGPDTAANVVVTDVMSGTDRTKYTAGCTVGVTGGSISPASPWSAATLGSPGGQWTIGSLAAGATRTLTLNCIGDNNSGVTNTATVTSSTHDPNAGNNSAQASVVDSVLDVVAQLVYFAGPVYVGQQFVITPAAYNPSSANEPNLITITLPLPAGTAYVGYSDYRAQGWLCSYASATAKITCTYTRGFAPYNSVADWSGSLQIILVAPSVPGTVVATETVVYAVGAGQFDPPDNNTASTSILVLALPTDIALSKTVDNKTPAVNSNVTFTIRASNIGTNAATNVKVKDLLPSGLTYVSSNASQGSYDSSTGFWSVGTVAGSSNATLTVTATAIGGVAVNTACLYTLDQTDTSSANNCASETVTPQVADLWLTQTPATQTVNVTSNAAFIVTLGNNGPATVSSVVVQDLLPPGIEFVSINPSAGSTYNAGTGVMTFPAPLDPGSTVAVALVGKVTVPGTMVNTATIVSASLPDANPANNSASATVIGVAADIAVTKAVDIPAPTSLNTLLTFTLTATNNGPSAATGVELTDVLPAGLQIVLPPPPGYTAANGKWAVGSLASGASATLTLKAKNTVTGTLVNTVTKTGLNQFDTDTTNDSASASVLSGGGVDLQLTKSVNMPNVAVSQDFVFTVKVTNNDIMAATKVQVTDLLPTGLNYKSHTVSQGGQVAYDHTTGIWLVGTVGVGQTVILQVTANAAAAGRYTNTATITALDQADPKTSDNSDSATVNVQASADLAITKTGPGSAPFGAPVTYTIIATNNGPSNVVGATIADTVPAGFGSVTWTCVATGNADCDTTATGTGATGSGNAITLPNVQIGAGAGNSVKLTVTGTAIATGKYVNTVIITPPANIVDLVAENNTANFTTVVSRATVSGRVFADTGTGGGIANNGIRDGGELGIPKVSLALTDCGTTTHATTLTDGDGNYTLAISTTLAAGSTLCAVETNVTGYVSTGGQAGSTGGNYDRTGDRVQFTLGASTIYTDVNFGDVPENRFLTDGAKTIPAGTTAVYSHVFIAGTAGTVTFTPAATASPIVTGWTQVIYIDTDCDGVLQTPVDTLLTGPIAVTESQRVCLLMQQFAPAGLAQGASNVVVVLASFGYSNATPAVAATYTRQDVTTVSNQALVLRKEVRNTTQAGSGGAYVTSNSARSGDQLEYRITYTNNGATSIQNLQVRDTTPSFTLFDSATCGVPLPLNLTGCVVTAPAPLSSNGAILWQFNGTLSPGVSGTVNYSVKVE